MPTKEVLFHEWLMGRGAFPYWQDGVDVPLPRGFYVCLNCKEVTNYWEPGMVCGRCEYEGERQQEEGR